MRMREFALLLFCLALTLPVLAQDEDAAAARQKLDELRNSMKFLEPPGPDATKEPHGLRLTNGKQNRYLRRRAPIELAEKALGLECLPDEAVGVRSCDVPRRWQPALGMISSVAQATLHFTDDQFFRYQLTFGATFSESVAAAIVKSLGKPDRNSDFTVRNLMGAEIPAQTWFWQTDSTDVFITSHSLGDITEGEMLVAFRPLASELKSEEVEAPF